MIKNNGPDSPRRGVCPPPFPFPHYRCKKNGNHSLVLWYYLNYIISQLVSLSVLQKIMMPISINKPDTFAQPKLQYILLWYYMIFMFMSVLSSAHFQVVDWSPICKNCHVFQLDFFSLNIYNRFYFAQYSGQCFFHWLIFEFIILFL